jgi:mannose-6-phosphate isomerase
MPELLQVVPEYHHRVWGGQQLKPNLEKPYGEAWLVFEGNKIKSGPYAGRRLEEVARVLGADLLGARALERTGTRFPLLIKILDCADWLSVQVHPNDEQALKLEGKGQFGKTEAWHVLDAVAGAELIAGVKPGTTADQLEQAIRDGSILEISQKHKVETGATIMMPAGTLHALGPGFLIYEVQQTSDTTYRVWDWNRPASTGRALHIAQSIAVTDPNSRGEINHHKMQTSGIETRVESEYFKLEEIRGEDSTLKANTENSSFHAITVTEGRAEVVLGDARVTLGKFETVIVPANAFEYRIEPLEPFIALRSSVPSTTHKIS